MNGNWSDYERFLKPVHLKGQSVTLTIVKATEEETHPQKGKTVLSPVIWFREIPFGLILSPTNRQTLIGLYGDRVSDCLGKPIVVKAVKEKVAGRDKEPIRIQNMRPNAPKIEVETGEIVEPPVQSVPSDPATRPSGDMSETTTPAASIAQQPALSSEPPLSPEGEAELDKFFGPNPRAASAPRAEVAPLTNSAGQAALQTQEQWPTTEAAFNEWMRLHGWNGKQTHDTLGESANTYLKKNPGKGWADVAKSVNATMRN